MPYDQKVDKREDRETMNDNDTHAPTCDCSEDYGPCKEHCEVIVQREGSSSRTADELVQVFLLDVLDIAEYEKIERGMSPAEWRELALALIEANEHWTRDELWQDGPCSWLREDVAPIQDDIPIGESVLASLGLDVWWDDGYVILRVTRGPLGED